LIDVESTLLRVTTAEGYDYAANRSHIATNAIKTNCPIREECILRIKIAKELLQVFAA